MMWTEPPSNPHLDSSETSAPSIWTIDTAIDALTTTQLNFLAARLWQTTDKAAAQQIGISPKTVYNWSADEKSALRWLQAHYTTNAIETAQQLLTRAVLKATLTKIDALDAETDTVKQDAATEILDRVIGRARQALDITTNQPTLKAYVNISPDMWDEEQ